MDLWRADLARLTYADIEAFIAQSFPESIRLDYKAGFGDDGGSKSREAANKDIAKDLSAFANTQGGLLVIGVEEAPKRRGYPGAIVGRPKKPGEDTRQRIEAVALSSAHVYPPLAPRIGVVDLPHDPTREVVAIQIDESPDAPHWIDRRQGFYVRREGQNDPVPGTDEDYEWLRRKRERAVALRTSLLETADQRCSRTLAPIPIQGAQLYAWAIPLYPRQPLADLQYLRRLAEQAWQTEEKGLPFYPDGELRSTHSDHGALVYVKELSTTTRSRSMDYFSVNEYGGVDYACLLEAVNDVTYSGSPARAYDEGFLVRQWYLLLKYARRFYQTVGYWGLVQVGVRLDNIQNQTLYTSTGSYNETIGVAEFDNTFAHVGELDQTLLDEPIPAILVEFLRRLRWCFGAGRRDWPDSVLEEGVESVRRGIHGNEPCQCRKHQKVRGEAACLWCRRQAAAQSMQPSAPPTPVAA